LQKIKEVSISVTIRLHKIVKLVAFSSLTKTLDSYE